MATYKSWNPILQVHPDHWKPISFPVPSGSIQSSGDQVSHPAWRIEAEKMSLQQQKLGSSLGFVSTTLPETHMFFHLKIGGFFRWHFLLGPSAYFQGCLRLVKGREVYGSLIPITMKNPEIPSLLYLSVGTSWQPIWKLTLCIFSRDAHIIWIHSMTSRNKKFTRQKKPGEFTAGSLIIFTQFAQIRLLRSPGFFN